VVQDFEGGPSIKRWPKDGPGEAVVSTAWSADGRASLRLDAGMMGSFRDLALSDWTGYGALRFTVHNPGPRTAGVGLEVQDEAQGFDDRHQHSFGAPPGDHVIELDFSGGLWRGEENRPYRGHVKGPIDVSRITRLAFVNRGAGPIWVDHLELVKVPPLATAGGFAFDFGPSGQQVMGQTTGVFESTRYTADRGFGLLGPVTFLPRTMSYPTPLLGDGLALGDTGFQVDLPGGPYLGWIAFERGGFWEGEQSAYAHAEVRVNGAAVAGHDFSRGAPHFLFEDLEITDLSRIEQDLVIPAHAVTRFRFQAAAGANVLTVAVTGGDPRTLRVAGILLAPDTPAGAAFLEAHEARQRAAIAASYPPEDRSRRGARRAPPTRDLVFAPVPPGEPVYPGDLPEHPEGAPPGEVLAVTGQTAAFQVGLYAPRLLRVHAEAGPLTGPAGATLVAPVVRHGRYLPMRPLGNGPVWLEINHYRPDPDFPVGPGIARALLLEWRVPADAAPGVYTGTVLLTAGEVRVPVPVQVRVFAVALPDLPVPVGLFMNALPFGPEVVGEARWWELQDALRDEQARAGINCVTGGTGLDLEVKAEGEGVGIAGDRALRYLDRWRGHPLRAVVPYGGFVQLRGSTVDGRAFGQAWLRFADDHHLPPFFFPVYDEPGTPEEIEVATAAVLRFAPAGIRTMGFTSVRPGNASAQRLLEITAAPALNEHSAQDLDHLVRHGGHPWIYNNGIDRYGMGLSLWRQIHAGAQGRLEWIGLITQGFAYDNLDGREPSAVAWMIHDRLGPMPTPRWLAAREGLLDLRIRLALEKAVPPGDPSLTAWSTEGYGTDHARWTDAALTEARRMMLERLAAAGR
jgi:hypothetical protein